MAPPSASVPRPTGVADAAPGRPGFGRRFDVDEDGRLYDSGFRAHLRRKRRLDPEELATAEALAALVTCGKIIQQRFEEHLQRVGLSHQQFRLLGWVNSCGDAGTHLHEIADWLRVTPRHVTGLVDGLEADGLVERVPDPDDRRATIARLTPEGEARATAAKREYARVATRVMSVLTLEEKNNLRDSTLKVLRALECPTGERSRSNG